MTDDEAIPQNYEMWRHCITVRCGLPLTQRFIDERLEELQNLNHPKTRAFATRYGEPYLANIVAWFQTARQEVASEGSSAT